MAELKSPYMVVVDLARPASQKTMLYAIRPKSGNGVLGEVKWYGPWRCCCFFPAPETVFNAGCLGSIINFLLDLDKEYKAKG